MPPKLHINPWLTMWLKPRETILAIIKYNPRHLALLLAFLYGISRVIDRGGLLLFAFLVYNPFLTTLGVLVIGAVSGVILVYLSAFLFELTGKLLGGRGSSENLRAAIVWSYVPSFWILPLDVISVTLLPWLITISQMWVVPYLLISIADIVVGIWSFVLLLQTIGEVHGFSAWKALAALILSLLALLVVVFVIALVVILPIKVLS